MMKKHILSPEWTDRDRLVAIGALLPDMQKDIYAGQYSVPGRPNITSLQHIIVEPAGVLEPYRAELQAKIDAAFEQAKAFVERRS